ncbi:MULTISPECIES: hypothetical protein [Hydrocarboniphaga]|uniref:Uncharacterized protein n=1 Tax=Hydrocarboniphaga effusa AP103 TaxID=1172194 RepID=I8T8T0_9GAMM|nr:MULTISPECIES: hypothetical protein [Hydrocarboniphaga]EIT69976.1 hypothetical protein WQQ_01130 [Hydrocarboniphaga effusa AP103]EIT70163.1 hypothetical protein WQQ_03000 [Hydrocarboniphaga effusa AP103]MDZ4077208.1 hypothetical protein [Hydrocarboniphaga sp.]
MEQAVEDGIKAERQKPTLSYIVEDGQTLLNCDDKDAMFRIMHTVADALAWEHGRTREVSNGN